MSDRLAIGFTSKLVPVKPINDQMTLCKCYVMAIGKNQNKSNISKEAVEDALPTLFNIPVVGHLFVDKENNVRMGGHDMALERDTDGKYKFKVLTVPYGVVPQQENAHFEELKESDGTKKTYLVSDIILWTGRYPELINAKYSEETYFNQSMEILPTETSKDDGYTNIEKFQFSALCLLGKSNDKNKNVDPCFELSRVDPYEFSATEEWAKLFGEFKSELERSYETHNFEKGGKKELNTEKIKSILLEFNLSEDTQLTFEVTEEMTEEDFRAKLTEVYSSGEPAPSGDDANANGGEQGNDGGKGESNNGTDPVVEPKLFAADLTYKEKHEALSEACSSLSNWNEIMYEYFYLKDFDDKYTYCYHEITGRDIEAIKETVRIPYFEAEGKITIEASKKEAVRAVYLTKEDQKILEDERKEREELAKYKADRIEDDRKKAYAAVISEFSDLGEIDEFKEVVKDAMTFESEEALSEKLYAIRGKNAKKPEKKPLAAIRIPVGFEAKSSSKAEAEDKFMAKYLSAKK